MVISQNIFILVKTQASQPWSPVQEKICMLSSLFIWSCSLNKSDWHWNQFIIFSKVQWTLLNCGIYQDTPCSTHQLKGLLQEKHFYHGCPENICNIYNVYTVHISVSYKMEAIEYRWWLGTFFHQKRMGKIKQAKRNEQQFFFQKAKGFLDPLDLLKKYKDKINFCKGSNR